MKESKEAYSQSHKLVENIPMGQPVLIGHHSESTHRRILDRSWNTLGKAVKLSEKAEYFEQKAKAAESNDSIYLGDDDAVERLEEKLTTLEKKQETMKATNKILRSKKLHRCEVCGTGILARSGRAKYCPACAKKVHRQQKAKSARKRRSGVDNLRAKSP